MTAQRTGDALDKLITLTEMTKRMNAEEIDSRSRDGAYLHGLYMEGAKWAPNDGAITKATPREMFSGVALVMDIVS
eukprot:g2393.t1